MKIRIFYSSLFTVGILFLSLHSFSQQVLGDFTGLDQSEWPKVYWYRDTGNNWDEGLLKNSSTQSSVFGRAGYGIHMHESRQFTFWSSGWNPLFAIEGGTGNAYLKGNVSIGTLTPTAGVLVAQGLITSQTATKLNPGNNDAFNLFAGGGGYADGARHSIVWSQSGDMLARFGTEYNSARSQIDFIWRDQYSYGPSSLESMRLTGGGNLGIGTSTPDAKLAVNGTVHSKEVKVDMNAWPDYVFKPAYKLVPLARVKVYVDQNHHLPEMPSASEIEKQGLNLGEMNKLLLKKVEELTLYLIDLKKDNEILEARVKKLETVK